MAPSYTVARNGLITVPGVRGSVRVYRASAVDYIAYVVTNGTAATVWPADGDPDNVLRADWYITRDGRWFVAGGERYRTLNLAAAAMLVDLARAADATLDPDAHLDLD